MTATQPTRDSGKDSAEAQIDQIEELVCYIAYASNVDVGGDHDLRITSDSGPGDEAWKKQMDVATGSIESSGLIHLKWSSGDEDTEDMTGELKVFPVWEPKVSMGATFTGVVEGTENSTQWYLRYDARAGPLSSRVSNTLSDPISLTRIRS